MVDGVVSARLTAAPDGRGKPGLRLVARADRPLAALLHDVSSTLRERFDVELDAAAVQVAVVVPDAAGAQTGPRWQLVSVTERAAGVHVDVAVQLCHGDRLATGYARVRARSRSRPRAAALAVLDAARAMLGVEVALELVGVEEFPFNDRSVAVVALALTDADRVERFTGLAERAGERDDEHVARATLDALNRRLRLIATGTRRRGRREVAQEPEMAYLGDEADGPAASHGRPHLTVIQGGLRRRSDHRSSARRSNHLRLAIFRR